MEIQGAGNGSLIELRKDDHPLPFGDQMLMNVSEKPPGLRRKAVLFAGKTV